MKKIILITLFVCCCISMSFNFGSCSLYSSAFDLGQFLARCLGYGMSFGDGNVDQVFLIAVGNNGLILKSTGADTIHFTSKNSGTTENLNELRIQPTSFEAKFLAVGNNGTIIRSTDIGETWVAAPPVTSVNLYGCELNSVFYYAVGDNGTILSSFNGTNWSQQTSTTIRNLKSISMHANSGGTLIAAGEKGTILRTTNSGQNWQNVSIPDTTINFYCISQKTRQNFNATNFYIAGSQGKIYKSTDMGLTWSLKNSGTTNTLRSIFFKGNDSGAVSGDNGTILMTTNAGETWFSDPYFNNVTGTITSISEMPRSAGTFTALSNNTRLHVTSEDSNLVLIGITNISSEVPNDFSLMQNYPNPFNPVTKLKFQISKLSDAKLIIYDIRGRVLEILVNKTLTAGTYEADFNGSKYSSGIYFYKLTAGNFTETKKMVLTK